MNANIGFYRCICCSAGLIGKRYLYGAAFLLAMAIITAGAQQPPALKDVFKNDFLIGAALNPSQFSEANRAEAALVKQQFNSISPENVLKWESVHPEPGQYDFALADRYVAFGQSNAMFVIGHNLVWHSQTPGWVFRDQQGKPLSRDVLLDRMRDHIFTVVKHYEGKIKGWDVVNEALAENGRLRDSPWHKIIGDDYIEKAFQFAHEADPRAELYYNDYGLEKPEKRAGALALVRRLKSLGIPITGVGLQGHYSLNWPDNSQLTDTIEAFARLKVKVMITELDVDVLPSAWDQGEADVGLNYNGKRDLNPYPNGLPRQVELQLAKRYADLFRIFVAHRNSISRVTLWGVTDGDSWLNNWPVPGRTNYPLLFDRNIRPKACFQAVIDVVSQPPPAVSNNLSNGSKSDRNSVN